MIKVTLHPEKETKNTVRFTEEGPAPYIGTLYVPKSTLVRELGWSEGKTLELRLEVSR